MSFNCYEIHITKHKKALTKGRHLCGSTAAALFPGRPGHTPAAWSRSPNFLIFFKKKLYEFIAKINEQILTHISVTSITI